MNNSFLEILKQKIVVFDGATGTYLQNQNLSIDDFGGEKLAGCNENLVVSKPSVVSAMHEDYLKAGADVIETDSFGGTSIVLAEYGLQDRAYELNLKAAQIARQMADDFSGSGHKRFVAGSMGPTTKLPSLGHIDFHSMAKSYYEQARGLVDGGADLLSVETCQDVLQIKAALYGVFQFFRNERKRVPLLVSVTVETVGTMLLGTEISAALTAIELYDVDVFGMNCATGPKEMSEHVRVLADSSPIPIFVMPNAGLPENVGGQAHYHLTPEDFVHYQAHFVKDLGANVVGGCCGTTMEHIRQLVDAVGNLSPKPRKPDFIPSASSLYQTAPFHIVPPPVMIGERTNANGSKLFRELLGKEDWEGIVAMGREQVKEQAHMIDVCAAFVGRDEAKDMREIIARYNTQVQAPLVIDSTEANVIEEALQRIGGKAVVNSINLEDGEERTSKVVPLCKDYGAAVIALTIDEKGMAKTAEAKLTIAKRIYDLVVNKYAMKSRDLIFDTLTFTLGSGDEEFRKSAMATIEAIRLIKEKLPGVHTSLGVSNVSFGLAPHIRHVLNSVFLHYAVEAGLDMAIVHASRIMPLYKIDERGRELSRQLIFDERQFEGEGDNRKCIYDPLTELMAHFAGKKQETSKKQGVKGNTAEERLKNRIIDGDKAGLQKDLDDALQRHPALEIINGILLDGMKVVGELFGAGQMQLPFVLQSAEVMKAAVAYLEKFMEKKEGSQKGTMVIATVKGDVHDIGKNLVDIILTNNGYNVINLGIKCPLESMLKAAEEQKADVIGMSGLLVRSTLIMKENLEEMNERGLSLPVILGGAALTKRYVEQDLRSIYKGKVFYANDAFDGLKLMETVKNGGVSDVNTGEGKEEAAEDSLTGSEAKIALAIAEVEKQVETNRSKVSQALSIPRPPFWGSKVVDDVSLDDVFAFVNDVALIRGQWRVVKGKLPADEYKKILDEKIYPEYVELKKMVKRDRLLQPKVVYGYFPCQSQGNNLIIYQPPSSVSKFEFKMSQMKEWLRFTFPRQTDDRNLCIADYFLPVESRKIDVVAFHLVTVGKVASEYSKKLFSANHYKEYLYFHGLSVESAEALAELWHKRVREELGIAGKDASEIKRLFSQGYQGSRFSFGYPACPNLEDQAKLFKLLDPKRIGVRLSEEFQLDPEQSTSAIIVHHPDARYFNVK